MVNYSIYELKENELLGKKSSSFLKTLWQKIFPCSKYKEVLEEIAQKEIPPANKSQEILWQNKLYEMRDMARKIKTKIYD